MLILWEEEGNIFWARANICVTFKNNILMAKIIPCVCLTLCANNTGMKRSFGVMPYLGHSLSLGIMRVVPRRSYGRQLATLSRKYFTIKNI